MIPRLLSLTPKRIWAGVKYRVNRYTKLGVGRLAAVGAPFHVGRKQEGLRFRVPTRWFFTAWPAIWRVIAIVDRVLPERGRMRSAFIKAVFTRPWNRWCRSAYIPEKRDLFFEYILTFSYQYPIRPGDVVVQIGASFGEETARFARSVGSKGRVFAVEPEARNVQLLKTTFAKDKFPQVTIIPKAASDRHGMIQMLVGGEREHRIADIPGTLTYDWWGVSDTLAESRYRARAEVETDTIDNILSHYSLDRVDFVLVETNGSELEVVQGMLRTLSITRRLGVRGHVKRDGVPIYFSISALLQERGYQTCITSEGMVLARRGRQ